MPPHEPHSPSIPPEIWIRILSYNTDLTHLWSTCRHISRTFLAYTEQVFAEYVLRDTYLDFQLEKYNLGGKSKRPEIPCEFARFGWVATPNKEGRRGLKTEDGTKVKEDGDAPIRATENNKSIAWFKDKRAKNEVGGGKRKEYDRIMERWEDNVRTWKPEMPNYTLQIGTMVNDTALPGLQINIAAREVGFDWRRMFALFFREQSRLRALKRKWNADTAKQIQANNARLAKGEKLSPSDYPVSWPAAEVELRKEIRRARLKEHYKGDEEMAWAIGSLKHFHNFGATTGTTGTAFKLNPDLPGAGLGEKWFGSVNRVQELYLDEWSCMHRIDTKVEHLRNEGE